MKLTRKRILALFLCLAMVFSFTITAFASDDESNEYTELVETVETTPFESLEGTEGELSTETELVFSEINLPEIESGLEKAEDLATRNPGDKYTMKYINYAIHFGEGVNIPSYYSYLQGKNVSGSVDAEDRKYLCTADQSAAQGKLIYCIEPAMHSVSGEKYTEADQANAWRKMPYALRGAMGLAMAYGYPFTALPTASDDTYGQANGPAYIETEKYYATQLIIWEFIVGYRSTSTPYRLTDAGKVGGAEKSHFLYYNNGNYRYENWKTILSAYNAIDESLRTHANIPVYCKRTSDSAPTYILEYQAKSNTYCYKFPDNLISSDSRCTTPLPEGIYYMRNTDKQVTGFTATKEAAEALPAEGLVVKVTNPCPVVDPDTCGVAFICENNAHQPLCLSATPDPATGYFRLKIDAPQSVNFHKTDIGGTELPGASISLFTEDGELVESWTSSEEPHTITSLERGKTYIMHEDLAPLGYATASDVEFTVNESGVVAQDIYMVDIPTTTEISKENVAGEEIPGATLTLFDADGEVVESWVSSNEAHIVTGLHVGKTYTLHEEICPFGYVTASDVEFTVSDTADVQPVVMVDELSRFKFIKLNEDGEPLEGGEFQILDSEGNVLYEWISSAEPFVCEGLCVGTSYAMHEVTAPEGYAVADDVAFIVRDTNEVQIIIMTDAPNTVEISKQDITGDELPGADLTVTDSEGNVVDKWTSTEEPHIITSLVTGETYTLHEDLCPLGYASASDVEFTILGDGTVQQVVMVDEITKFEFIKLDEKNQPLSGGVFQILDKNNKVVYEWTSSDKPFACEGLYVGETYRMHEVKAPKGYEKAADVKFVVKDTAKVQVIKMVDYPVTGDTTNTTRWIVIGGIALAILAASMTTYVVLKKRVMAE